MANGEGVRPWLPAYGAVKAVVPVLLGGAVTGVGTLVASTSFAALIFAGPLAPHVGRGIGIALFTAVVAGVLVSLFSSCKRSIAIPQDRIAPMLALMAAFIAASVPPGTSPQETFVTVTTAIALTSLVTGLLLGCMGLFRIGGLIRFLPYSVIGGFLAGTGWLLVLGGLRVMTSLSLDASADVGILLQPELLLKWLPGVAVGAVVMATASRIRHAVALPLVLVSATIGFYAVAHAAHLSVAELGRAGWLLGPLESDSAHLWSPLTLADLTQANWSAIFVNIGSVGTIMLLSAVSLLLTVSALEILSDRDLDVDRELRVAGLTNLVSALGGGMVAFHSLSFSALAISLGTQSRLIGVVSALICGAALWSGPELFGYLPRLVLGGLLVFLGFSFLHEWLIKTWSRLPRSEYAIILLILVIMAGFGFLNGMAAGLLAAIVLFVVNYSRIGVVRYAIDGSHRRSTVERHPAEEHYLREHGGRTQVLKLQGYLFFGTTRALLRTIERRAHDQAAAPLGFVLLDLQQVTGIDPSAIYLFAKIAEVAHWAGFGLVLSAVDPGIHRQLHAGAVDQKALEALRFFPDLDHGLEWCEERILDDLDRAQLAGRSTVLLQICDRLASTDQRSAFMEYLERRFVPAGHLLVRQNSPSDAMFFVETGSVSVYRETGSGGRIRLRRTGPGTAIGELGLYLGGVRSASVTTDGAATIYRLSTENLVRMEQEAPEIAVVFHRFMAEFSADRQLRDTRTLEQLSE